MTNKRFKPEWDRGNGWKRTKAEWSDLDKAENLTVSLEELKDLRCPASGSTITVDLSHLLDGLQIYLDVGIKEYRENKKGYGGKYEYRKPTMLRSNVKGSQGIPIPGIDPHRNNWCEKKTWSSAVKVILEEIIPIYEEANNTTMCMWSVVRRESKVLS